MWIILSAIGLYVAVYMYVRWEVSVAPARDDWDEQLHWVRKFPK